MNTSDFVEKRKERLNRKRQRDWGEEVKEEGVVMENEMEGEGNKRALRRWWERGGARKKIPHLNRLIKKFPFKCF